jgi:hypothetical protein
LDRLISDTSGPPSSQDPLNGLDPESSLDTELSSTAELSFQRTTENLPSPHLIYLAMTLNWLILRRV